jgi:hypothetical protein
MKNILLILIGLVVVTSCSTKQASNKKSVEPAKPDSLIENQESAYAPSDTSKIETSLFFNDPLRNLNDFTICANYPPFDKIINDLSNSKNVQETIKSDFCWGDCCGSYKDEKHLRRRETGDRNF